MLLHEMLDLGGLHERRDPAQVDHSALGQPLIVVLDLPGAEWFERALQLLPLLHAVRLLLPIAALLSLHEIILINLVAWCFGLHLGDSLHEVAAPTAGKGNGQKTKNKVKKEATLRSPKSDAISLVKAN